MITRSALLRRSFEKTVPQLAALAAHALPRFVYTSAGDRPDVLPVFVYHVVDASFEADLRYLQRGGYRTAGAEELAAYGRDELEPDGRTVALTFDDGDESLTRVAVPLLERYGFCAVAFVVTEMVPETTGRELAGWAELRAAVSRGALEVGSHSCYHHHVPVSARVVGFVDSGTDIRFTANIPVPRIRGDEVPTLGTPIFRGRPRYTAPAAFQPDADRIERCRLFVRERGEEVLRRSSGVGDLRRLAPRSGSRETPQAADAAVVADVSASLDRVGTRCPNAAARHLCFPWYARNRRAEILAERAGATLLLGGYHPTRRGGPAPLLQRLSRDLMRRLPGPDRESLLNVLRRRGQAVGAGHGWPGNGPAATSPRA
ncbi:MAG TPA: polysaccharide deacetylase family protein [Gemmatimonadales bacterium]